MQEKSRVIIFGEDKTVFDEQMELFKYFEFALWNIKNVKYLRLLQENMLVPNYVSASVCWFRKRKKN